jgi:hypothetical protein
MDSTDQKCYIPSNIHHLVTESSSYTAPQASKRSLATQLALDALGHALGKVLKVMSIYKTQTRAEKSTYLDIVIVQTSHGNSSILGHVDMSLVSELFDLVFRHYILSAYGCGFAQEEHTASEGEHA